MQLTLYTSWSEMDSFRPQWNALLASSASDTIFLTWEWCQAWWRNYGAGRTLFVVAAWERGELVGVAPFYLDRIRRWGMSWRCLRLVGDGSFDSDYLDCFGKPGRESEFIAAVLKLLCQHRDRWDWIEIHGPAQASPCLAAWQECAKQQGWKSQLTPVACASLRLPSTWEAYLQQLQTRFRSKVRSCLRTLETQFDSAPRECNDPAQLESWLPAMFDLHTRRWQSRNQGGVFGNPSRRSFYSDISRVALQNGWLAFYRLDWAERPLALQYGFRYNNRFFLLQEGYDPDFETLRPGVSLRAWLIRHWIENGLEEYDFLAGTSSYKLEWGGEQKFSYLFCTAQTAAGELLALEYPRIREEMTDTIRPFIPPAMLGLKRVLAENHSRPIRNSSVRKRSLLRRSATRAASILYATIPVRTVSRHVADRFAFSAEGAGIAFAPLGPRTVPVSHIFIYHRVNDEDDPFFEAMPIAQFRAQMTYLRKYFHFASLDEVADGGSSSAPGYRAIITFDDGYRDNFLYAFPVLKELGIPATIFLTTGFVESGEIPWYDGVRLAYKLTMQKQVALSDLGGPSGVLETREQRLACCAQTLGWLRTADDRTRQAVLPEIFRRLHVPVPCSLPNTMLSWEEIRRMAKDGINFGAHTMTHPSLAGVPLDRLEQEIAGSKKIIEQRLQVPVRHFAYPFGKPADVGSLAKQVVRNAGFSTAVTTVEGLNGPEQDLLELKRFSITEPDPGLFALKLDWYRMKFAPKPVLQPPLRESLYREASSRS